MEPAPGYVRRSLHRMIRHATRRIDACSETTDRLIDADPSALAGIALGFARFVIALLSEASGMTRADHK